VKFLCVPCDQPMKLRTTTSPNKGLLSVVYTCPACDYEIAMLTNPFETQLVQSLGVRIGPAEPAQAEGTPASTGLGSGCPFSGMLAEAGLTAEASPAAPVARDVEVTWTPAARARLQNIPEFVRPMATQGIEKLARQMGRNEVDEAVLDEARAFFGM
jgi:hypothetical protein